jgi:hypothetical protein
VKKIGLRFATVLLVVLSSLTLLRAQEPTPEPVPLSAVPPLVYRYDCIPPERADGTGIFQTGFVRPTGLPLDIAAHVDGNPGSRVTGIVSTSRSYSYVRDFAARWGEYNDFDATTYWVYQIVPDENFVDVTATWQRTRDSIASDPNLAYTGAASQLRSFRAIDVFTHEYEFASLGTIPTSRILMASEYNSTTQQWIRNVLNPNANFGMVATVHPNTYPLGTWRENTYVYNLPGTPYVDDVNEGASAGFVCETVAEPEDANRSTRSVAVAIEQDTCAGAVQTVLNTIPANTPAGFGILKSQTANVLSGDYRQWVDINGDGYADYCRLIGNNTKVSCIINDQLNFKTSIDNASGYTVDGGWSSVANGNRDWLPANGGQTGMYCRSVDNNAVKCDEIF